MNPIQNLLFTEKYRPSSLKELIFAYKNKIIELLKKPLEIPSLIFYSAHPGTGKTSTAKIIIKNLQCD